MTQYHRFHHIQFPLILATAFLDILGIAFLLPILPFLIHNYGVSGEWVSYTLAIFSFGMFVGGFVFGKLSDKYGRRNMLIVTTIFNILGYLTVIFAPYFLIFAMGRFVAGLAGAGIGVTQAYISDISTPENRTKQMGLIGAMFGLGFLVGPGIGGIISTYSYTAVGVAGLVAAVVNLLLIILFLPEPKKHVPADGTKLVAGERTKLMLSLFVLSFAMTVAFSPIQSISSQYNVDRFHFDSQQISYALIVVGFTSIVYQGLLIKYVRKYFNEVSMIHIGLVFLMAGFCLQAFNQNVFWIWAILPLFPLGMGTIQPSISSLVARDAGHATGKYLGMNNSYMSLGNIVGPILAGYLYTHSIALPFWVSGGMFGAILLTSYILIPNVSNPMVREK